METHNQTQKHTPKTHSNTPKSHPHTLNTPKTHPKIMDTSYLRFDHPELREVSGNVAVLGPESGAEKV